MDPELVTRIANNPNYQALKAKRTRFGWWLTLMMMIAYYGFILLVAFDKPFLATRIGAGVTTIGMPIGLGIIVFTVLVIVNFWSSPRVRGAWPKWLRACISTLCRESKWRSTPTFPSACP